MKKKINVYIDGFNLYHVLLKNIKKWSKPWESELKWCNLRSLIESYLEDNHEIWKIYFFTADSWIKKTKDKWLIYQEALNNTWIDIIKWKYNNVTKTFIDKMKVIMLKMWFDIWKDDIQKYYPKRLKYKTYEEKRTDVNIAVKIVEDAFLWKYDNAIIMSWDSDIIPSIETVKRNFKDKKFTTLWINWTKWQLIKKFCDDHKVIWYKKMKEHKFKDTIKLKNWKSISIPQEWKILN